MAVGDQYTEVWLILKYPVIPRDVLAAQLGPLIQEALKAGGEVDSLSIKQAVEKEVFSHE
jgi:hypothetical protein